MLLSLLHDMLQKQSQHPQPQLCALVLVEQSSAQQTAANQVGFRACTGPEPMQATPSNTSAHSPRVNELNKIRSGSASISPQETLLFPPDWNVEFEKRFIKLILVRVKSAN